MIQPNKKMIEPGKNGSGLMIQPGNDGSGLMIQPGKIND
jgi:hypothetical protein